MLNQKNKMNEYLASQLWIALTLVFFLICTGFATYYFYFGYEPVDAFYMTVITIGTVGFGEVMPLDNAGKIFTSFLILFSVFIFAYAVTTISAYLVTVNTVLNFKQKKMEQQIQQLTDHVIICGYGRNGKQAALKLMNFKNKFVVIENNKDILSELLEAGILFIEGNATDDESLIKAGIKRAGHLITTLPSDSDNVFIVLTSKQLNDNIKIVSRASEESSIKKLKIAGADNIIMPDKIGGDHMASLIVAPDLVEFLDNLSSTATGNMNVQELVLSHLPEVNTIEDLQIKEKTGCTVIGYKTKHGDYIINPDISHSVDAKGRIIVLGNKHQIKKLNTVFKIT